MPDIGLQSQAERIFDFLVADCGYRRTESTPYRIRFESPAVFVEIVYDGERSGELALLVGKVASKEPPFTIDEILRLRRAPDAREFSLVQVTTRDALIAWLERMAAALRVFGGDCIAGDEKGFVAVAEQRRSEVQGYANDLELRAARRVADAAWNEHDYRGFVKALRPFVALLTQSEVGKLEFAEKRCRQ